ncbi:hypothetical protein [Pseudomonas cremoricolorata]|uniref:deoxynucleotide monophosphate kinase family protein n=1 Tax=Pseudomonas cremoricolorata TaxID=157783 RepID=UPI000414E4A1|nr:hypothetical protein [Pseudomonas cremoricolorata]
MPTIIGLAAIARSGKDTVACMLLEHPQVAAYALADPLKLGCQALFGLSDEQAWQDAYKELPIDLWGTSPRQMFQRAGTEWMRHDNPDHWLLRADRQLNYPAPPHLCATAEQLASPDAALWLAVQAFWGLNHEQTWSKACRCEPDTYWGKTPHAMFAILTACVERDVPDYVSKRARQPILEGTRRLTDAAGKSVFVIKDIRYENEAAFWRAHGGVIWHITRDDAVRVHAHSSELGIARASGDVVIENNGSLAALKQTVQGAWERLVEHQH